MNLRDIHTPVLLERCVELLAPALERDGAVLVDATLGMGGHSEAFLERFPGIHLVGLDRDQDALRIAGERLAPFGDRVTLVHTVYDGIADAVASAGFAAADGILFDLGVSSLQLDVADRGFAYSKDAPLDMRMDQSAGTTAADVLATYGEGDLRRIFERYGEEKLAGRYARAIIAARADAPIDRSGPARRDPRCGDARTPRSAPGTPRSGSSRRCASRSTASCRCSSARSRRRSASSPSAGASSCSPTSPSRTASSSASSPPQSASTAPAGLPVELPEHAPRFRLLVKGAELASDEERATNPRATPVRLRAAERLREAR